MTDIVLHSFSLMPYVFITRYDSSVKLYAFIVKHALKEKKKQEQNKKTKKPRLDVQANKQQLVLMLEKYKPLWN